MKPANSYTDNEYDLLIVGGGLTGATLALALAKQPIRIGIIDAIPQTDQPTETLQDLRSIALSYTSKRIFQGLDLWVDLTKYACSIQKIHISDRGHFGFTRIDVKQQNVDALGYVIAIQNLHQVLHEKLQKHTTVSYFDTKVTDIKTIENGLSIRTEAENTLTTKLLVAADGGQSTVRGLLDIKTTIQDYQQQAIVANVGLQIEHSHTAFERFTENGPIALLPLADKCYSLVWTVASEQLKNYMALDDKTFISRLQKEFGYRLGRFSWVGQRQSFPLKLLRATEQVRPGIVILGNANHTLHPVAGQGFNLGLRDVAWLAEGVIEDIAQERALGNAHSLQTYAKQRQWDQRSIIGLTDGLIRVFANNFLPLSLLRNLGLVGLDLSATGKHWIARKMMGFNGHLSDLALGQPLD